jgi:hypothetical protein
MGHLPGDAEVLAAMRLKGFVPAELPGRTARP